MATVTTTFITVNGMLMQETRGGVETYYIPDPLGSLVECRNSSGAKTYSAEYWPYGELQTSTGTNPSSWGYVGLLGYLVDSATMLYVRARYLMTKIARWLTVDPLWPWQKKYLYVDNTPGVFSDYSGLQPDRAGCGSSVCDEGYDECIKNAEESYRKCIGIASILCLAAIAAALAMILICGFNFLCQVYFGMVGRGLIYSACIAGRLACAFILKNSLCQCEQEKIGCNGGQPEECGFQSTFGDKPKPVYQA